MENIILAAFCLVGAIVTWTLMVGLLRVCKVRVTNWLGNVIVTIPTLIVGGYLGYRIWQIVS